MDEPSAGPHRSRRDLAPNLRNPLSIVGGVGRYYRITMPTITFKVSTREAARIREMATREGLTVSEFLRRRAVQPLPPEPGGRYRITDDPETGLPVMEAPAGVESVSSEQIRALLADFP